MATVVNLAQINQIVDQKFCSPNRTNAGAPNGSVTPQYVGEIVLDTTGNIQYRASGITNNSWVPITIAIV